jgi:O-succinylbenzoic acid--CoA ligase
MDYQFDTITLNQRLVNVQDICADTAIAQTEFERSTLLFLRDWLNGSEVFEVPTSGSTGTPRKISLTRSQMTASASMTIEALHLEKGDKALVCLNTQFIAGKMMLVRALTGNMRIIATEPSSNPLKDIVQPFDFIALVPLQIQSILLSPDKIKLDYIKAILIGGAALDDTQLKAVQSIKSPAFATYGMTETISHIALQDLHQQPANHSFKTLPEVKIRSDERGCLVIGTPYLTNEIVTNDLVAIHDEGHFSWLGRWDNIINTGGVKVIPEKVENDLRSLMTAENVTQNFLVGGIPDARLGEKIILITEGAVDEKWGKILTLHKQSFSRYETPREIFFIEKFIVNNNNKIDRKATINATMAQDFRDSKA